MAERECSARIQALMHCALILRDLRQWIKTSNIAFPVCGKKKMIIDPSLPLFTYRLVLTQARTQPRTATALVLPLVCKVGGVFLTTADFLSVQLYLRLLPHKKPWTEFKMNSIFTKWVSWRALICWESNPAFFYFCICVTKQDSGFASPVLGRILMV